MSPSLRLARALPWLSAWMLGGCAIDLLVGEDPDRGESASTSTSEPTTTELSTTDGTSPHETGTLSTTASDTTATLDEGTSTGPALEGTTTDSTLEGTTSGELACEGLGFADCNELAHCLWYGARRAGECAPSPCENQRHECLTLPYEDCQAAFACAWMGEPELGDCSPLECVPCELLDNGQCMEAPSCLWNEGEMFCLPA